MLRRPVIVAPMGGGPTTPELVTAAAAVGALGFLAYFPVLAVTEAPPL